MYVTKRAVSLLISTVALFLEVDSHQIEHNASTKPSIALPSSLDLLQQHYSPDSYSALSGTQSEFLRVKNASYGYSSTAKPPMHVVVLGGSFTGGVGANCETIRKRPSRDCAWPHHLERIMQSRGVPIVVENYAIAGSSAPGALPIIVGRIVASNAANPVDVVLIDYSPNHAALLVGKKKSFMAKGGLSKAQEVLCGTEALVRTLRCLGPRRPHVVFVEEGSRHVWPHGTLAAKYGLLLWNSRKVTDPNPHLPEASHQSLALEIADNWNEVYKKSFSPKPRRSKQGQFKYCDNRQEPAVDNQAELEVCPAEVSAYPEDHYRKVLNVSVSREIIAPKQAPPPCCTKGVLEGVFAHCALPLKFATGYELQQSLARALDPGGIWHLFEDKPGKPGMIADDRIPSFDPYGLVDGATSGQLLDSPNSPPLELSSSTSTSNSRTQSDLVFHVPLTKSGLITITYLITYLRSYENMGRVLVWLDAESPEKAKVVKYIDGSWSLNVSLTDTFTWLPNRFFVKSKYRGEGGPRTKDWYRTGNHTLHVRLLDRGNIDSSSWNMGDKIEPANPAPPGAGNKFKISSLSSC